MKKVKKPVKMYKNGLYDSCKICGELNVISNHYWKTHHIKEADYCLNYYPRYDKQTGELIKFKSREFYFSNDFNDKNSLKKWLKENPDKALDYALSIICRRKEDGKLIYVPSQVELRTINCPNIIWFLNHCNYNKECIEMGLIPRFDYWVTELSLDNQKLQWEIDTREQKVLKLDGEIKTLKFGDYHCINSNNKDIYIERKSLSDMISTLSSGYERFEREIERAKEAGAYIIVLVEDSLTNALSFNYLPHISKKIKASPEFVMHKIRLLYQKYLNIQFLFAENRTRMIPLMEQIYQYKGDGKILDWQLLLDCKFI